MKSCFDVWLLNLLWIHTKHDNNIQELLLRVGYTYQFNREEEFNTNSILMLVMARGNKYIAHELHLASLKLRSYDIRKKRIFCQKCLESEKYEKNPDILSKPSIYSDIYKEYYLRFTFLPNPTSRKARDIGRKELFYIRNSFYSACTLYIMEKRRRIEEEYIRGNNGVIPSKEVMNSILYERWRYENYDVKHRYIMLSFIDKLIFYQNNNKELDQFQLMVEEEKDYFKREKIISKLCDMNQIFGSYECDDGSENIDGEFVIYYIERIQYMKNEYRYKSIDEIGMMIYNEFINSVIYNVKEMERYNEICRGKKNVNFMNLINDNIIKYLPSRMIGYKNAMVLKERVNKRRIKKPVEKEIVEKTRTDKEKKEMSRIEKEEERVKKEKEITIEKEKVKERVVEEIIEGKEVEVVIINDNDKDEEEENDNSSNNGLKRKYSDNGNDLTCGSPISSKKMYHLEDMAEIVKELSLDVEYELDYNIIMNNYSSLLPTDDNSRNIPLYASYSEIIA